MGNRRTIKETLQQQLTSQIGSLTKQIFFPSRPIHSFPLPRKYNQRRMIEEIKQAEREMSHNAKTNETQPVDNNSDNYDSAGEDSESASDDMSEYELKRFHKAASLMLMDFENAFLKRINSSHSVSKYQNTTILKKHKPTKEKEKRKKSKTLHQ
jgi:hypothetical protein